MGSGGGGREYPEAVESILYPYNMRGARLVYPESKRAAGWVENRSEVIGMRVRIKGVIGAGVSGSKGERPGTMNVQRVAVL